jgi:hypothetical protein
VFTQAEGVLHFAAVVPLSICAGLVDRMATCYDVNRGGNTMIELTEEQRSVVSTQENPTIVDPLTKESYVLVRKDMFDRIKRLLYDDSEMTHDDLRLLLARSSKENGWDEPGMEEYDNYDEHRK